MGIRAWKAPAALLLALCGVAHAAFAEEDWNAEESGEQDWGAHEPSWIPSLSFGFDTFDYKTTNSVVNMVNPPFWQGVGTNSERELQLLTDGELMGPILAAWPGHPRPFASVGFQFSPFASDNIYQNGLLRGDAETDITQFLSLLNSQVYRPAGGNGCLDTTPPSCDTREPQDFDGQGSQIEAKFKTSWHAALGAAFTFPMGESLLLQVKPSIAYNVDQIDMTGTITTVTENPSNTWVDPNIPEYTIHRGGASSTATNHSLGPGLELAVALSRSRPIRASLFVDTRFLWLLGNPTTSFSDSVQGLSICRDSQPGPGAVPGCLAANGDPPVAHYSVRRDSFSFRAGAGVRLSWVGFSD